MNEGMSSESSLHIQAVTASCPVFSPLDPIFPRRSRIPTLRGLISTPGFTTQGLFILKPLTSLGLFLRCEKAAVSLPNLYLEGMRKSAGGMCFSHRSLPTTGKDHCVITIVASVHCSHFRPPHLLSANSLHPSFEGHQRSFTFLLSWKPLGASYFSVGENYSTNDVLLFYKKRYQLMQIITVGTSGSLISGSLL